jgi:small GTP-binding protein
MEKLVEYIILGPPEVGKTSIIQRYFDNIFNTFSYNTIGIDMRSKTINTNNDYNINLKMYDTAGQERYFTLVTNFIRNKECIFLCFSLRDKHTFDECKKYAELIEKIKDDNSIVFLVGTFLDMKNLTFEKELKEFISKYNYRYIEVSSKTGEGIRELFDISINILIENNLLKNIKNITFTDSIKNKKCCN